MGRLEVSKILASFFVVLTAISVEASSSFLPPIPPKTDQPVEAPAPTLPEMPIQMGQSQPDAYVAPAVYPPEQPPPTLPEPPLQMSAQPQFIAPPAPAPAPAPARAPAPIPTEITDSNETTPDAPFLPGPAYELKTLDPNAAYDPIDRAIRQRKIPFQGTVLVAQGSTILFREAYGSSEDSKVETPYARETKFLLASATKEFTAALVLKEIEKADGKINLEDPISKFFGKIPLSWKNITIAKLLSHTSELGDYLTYLSRKNKKQPLESPPCFASNKTEFYIDDDYISRFIAKMKTCPIKNNKIFNYSNTNYFLLGKILERVTHKSLSTLFREEITEPLEMTNTRMIEPSVAGSTTDFYGPDGTPLLNGPGIYYFGAGNVYSTIEDLFKWEKALFEDRIVIKSPELFQAMVTSQPGTSHKYNTFVPNVPGQRLKTWYTTYNGKRITHANYRVVPVAVSYGYGLRLVDLDGGKHLIYHSGHITNHTTLLTQYLEDKISIIILTNTDSAEIFGLEGEIAKTIFSVQGLSSRGKDQLTAQNSKSDGPDKPISKRARKRRSRGTALTANNQ